MHGTRHCHQKDHEHGPSGFPCRSAQLQELSLAGPPAGFQCRRDDCRPDRRRFAIHGPVVRVAISVQPPMSDDLKRRGRPVPAPVSGWAVIDTGARPSGIDLAVVKQLGLEFNVSASVKLSVVSVGPKRRTFVDAGMYPVRFSFSDTSMLPVDAAAAGIHLRSINPTMGPVRAAAYATRAALYPLPVIGPAGRAVMRTWRSVWPRGETSPHDNLRGHPLIAIMGRSMLDGFTLIYEGHKGSFTLYDNRPPTTEIAQ